MKYQVLIESERVELHLPNAPRICMECPNLLYVILPLLWGLMLQTTCHYATMLRYVTLLWVLPTPHTILAVG